MSRSTDHGAAPAVRLAGLELGGTKGIAVLAAGERIVERVVVPTTTPAETLEPLLDAVAGWHAADKLHALGIAAFGPVRLDPAAPDYGRVLTTPKPSWSGAALLDMVAARFSGPVALDTDVNAAALAEHRWGAGRGCSTLIYLTIGTGVGGGVLVDGRPVHGRLHPEQGHLLLRRAPGDGFAGACPFHGDCIEGLVSGPALARRFGAPPAGVAADDARWRPVAHDLAQWFAAMIQVLSPERIILGGGVGLGAPWLLDQAAERVPALLAGYVADLDMPRLIVPAKLGADAGPLGAVALAQAAID